MNELLQFSRLLIVIVTSAGLWIAFWVYFSDRKNKINQTFFFLTISSLLWIIFSFLGNIIKQEDLSLFFKRLNFATLAPFFIAAYLFSIYFPRESKRYLILDKIIIILGTLFFFLSVFTNLVVKDVEIKEWGVNIIGGNGFLFFNIGIIILTFFIIGNLIRKYFECSQEEKFRIQYLIGGAFIFGLLNLIFNVFLPVFQKTYQYDWVGDYSIIFLIGFTAFAIVKQELFGIRVILTQALVGVIAILLLAQALTSTNWLEFAWKFGIFLIFIYFGYLLVRSVVQEIKRRAEIQRLYEEVDKLSKAKSEFISIASHQLRTPLTAVKGYISMIIEGTYGKLSDRLLKPLGNVYQSNERLIKLVNDLLNLSRLEAGKIEFSPELTSLEEMVSGIIEELKINAEKKGLYMKMVKTSKPLPKVMVDQDKLRQVILNIIDNAIKYTKKGGITVELKKLDSWEQIRISDTGEGITEKELKGLFQMFSRATAGTQLHTEGAGIGLYVAKQFIEMHEGKILVESAGKGKGSTFIIKLPIHLDQKLLKEKTKTITK